MELKDQLAQLQAELKAHFEKAAEQQKATGNITAELKVQIEALQKQADALDIKLAEKHAAAEPEETLEQYLSKDEGLKKFMRDRNGNYVLNFDAKQARQFERKTTITSTDIGYATTGVLQIDRRPGIVPEARQRLMVRDVLTARPTQSQVIDFVRVNSPMTIASPQQGEGHDKKEAAVTFTAASERVKTLATWIPASRQVLDDMTELMGFLRSSLAYYVDLAEEQQLLTGSGSGEDLHGLVTQATAFSTALLPITGSYNRIDVIGRVIQQITSASELQPSFIVLNPVDWWSIRLTKDTQGRYILGDPMGPVAQEQLFGLTPVVTTSIASGTFLVGSGSPIATEIRDRMSMQIEIATQHASFFTQNLIAIRAEKREALIVYRPASFISGTFITSP